MGAESAGGLEVHGARVHALSERPSCAAAAQVQQAQAQPPPAHSSDLRKTATTSSVNTMTRPTVNQGTAAEHSSRPQARLSVLPVHSTASDVATNPTARLTQDGLSTARVQTGFVLYAGDINVLQGLARYDDVYTAAEQLALLEFLQDERRRGKRHELSGESYSSLKNGREVVQYGFHYDFRAGAITAQPVEPLPAELTKLIAHLAELGVTKEGQELNSAIVNFYYEPTAHITPHVDSREYVPTHYVLSLESVAHIHFGSASKGPGSQPIPASTSGVFNGPFQLELPLGSILKVAGNSAVEATHCISKGPPRVSVTLREVPRSVVTRLGIRDDALAQRTAGDGRLRGGRGHGGATATSDVTPSTAAESWAQHANAKGKGKGKGGALARVLQMGAGAPRRSVRLQQPRVEPTTTAPAPAAEMQAKRDMPAAHKPALNPLDLTHIAERGGPWRCDVWQPRECPGLEVDEAIRVISQQVRGEWQQRYVVGPSSLLRKAGASGMGLFTIDRLRKRTELEKGKVRPPDVVGWYGGKVVARADTQHEAIEMAQELVREGRCYLLVMQVAGYPGQFVVDGADESVLPGCHYINTTKGTGTSPRLVCSPFGKLYAVQDVPALDWHKPLAEQVASELSFDYDDALQFQLKVQAEESTVPAETSTASSAAAGHASAVTTSDDMTAAVSGGKFVEIKDHHLEHLSWYTDGPPPDLERWERVRVPLYWCLTEQGTRFLLRLPAGASIEEYDMRGRRVGDAAVPALAARAAQALVAHATSGYQRATPSSTGAPVDTPSSTPPPPPARSPLGPSHLQQMPTEVAKWQAQMDARAAQELATHATHAGAPDSPASIVQERIAPAVSQAVQETTDGARVPPVQLRADGSVDDEQVARSFAPDQWGAASGMRKRVADYLPPVTSRVDGGGERSEQDEIDAACALSLKHSDSGKFEEDMATALRLSRAGNPPHPVKVGQSTQQRAGLSAKEREQDNRKKASAALAVASEQQQIMKQLAQQRKEAPAPSTSISTTLAPASEPPRRRWADLEDDEEPAKEELEEAVGAFEASVSADLEAGGLATPAETLASETAANICDSCGLVSHQLIRCEIDRTHHCNRVGTSDEEEEVAVGQSCIVRYLLEEGSREIATPRPRPATTLVCLQSGNANVFSLQFAHWNTQVVVVFDKSLAAQMPGLKWKDIVTRSQPGDVPQRLDADFFDTSRAGGEPLSYTFATTRAMRRRQLAEPTPAQASHHSALQYVSHYRQLVALQAAHEIQLLKLQATDNATVAWERTGTSLVVDFTWAGKELQQGDRIALRHSTGDPELQAWVIQAELVDGNNLGVRATVVGGVDEATDAELPVAAYAITKSVNTVQYDRMQSALNFLLHDPGAIYSHTREQWLSPRDSVPPSAGWAQATVTTDMKRKLNESQLRAVEMAMTHAVSCINGPPGTGKTFVSTCVVRLWVDLRLGPVLVCAPSNNAANHLAVKLHELGVKVLRYFVAARANSAFADEIPYACKIDAQLPKEGHDQFKKLLKLRQEVGRLAPAQDTEFRKLRRRPYMQALAAADVVVCTCSAAGDTFISSLRFPFLLVDEAGQAAEPEVVVPLVNGVRRVVLVGDPKQLPPSVQSVQAKNGGLAISAFERLQTAGAANVMLNVQYRMHPAISRFPGQHFYEGLLADDDGDGSAFTRRRSEVAFPWPDPTAPTLFWHVFRAGVEAASRSGSTSYSNTAEIEAVADVVDQLVAGGAKADEIAVITAYEGQRQLLAARLAGHRNMLIGNIDAIQGREQSMVVLSLVRSNEGKGIGFLKGAQRVNVALTRAKHGLVIIGDAHTFTRYEPWRALLESYQSRNLLCEGDTLDELRPLRVKVQSEREGFAAFAASARDQGGCNVRVNSAHQAPTQGEDAARPCECAQCCVAPTQRRQVSQQASLGMKATLEPTRPSPPTTRVDASDALELSHTEAQLTTRPPDLVLVEVPQGTVSTLVETRVALISAASTQLVDALTDQPATGYPGATLAATSEATAEALGDPLLAELDDLLGFPAPDETLPHEETESDARLARSQNVTQAAAAQLERTSGNSALRIQGAHAIASLSSLRLFQYWWRARISGHLTNLDGRQESVLYWRLARSSRPAARSEFLTFVNARAFRNSPTLRLAHGVAEGTLRRFSVNVALFRLVRLMQCGYGANACLHRSVVNGRLTLQRCMATRADFQAHQVVARRVIEWYRVTYAVPLLAEVQDAALVMGFFAPGSIAEAARMLGFHVIGLDTGPNLGSARRWFGTLVPQVYEHARAIVSCHDLCALEPELRKQAVQAHPVRVKVVGQLDSPSCKPNSTLQALTGARRKQADVAWRREGTVAPSDEYLTAAIAFAQERYELEHIPYMVENVAGAGLDTSESVARHEPRAIDRGHQTTDKHTVFSPVELPFYEDRPLRHGERGGAWLDAHSCTGASRFIQPTQPHGALISDCCAGTKVTIHNSGYRAYSKRELCHILMVHPEHPGNKHAVNDMVPMLLNLNLVAILSMWAAFNELQLPMVSYDTVVRDPRLGAWVRRYSDEGPSRPSLQRAHVVIQLVNTPDSLLLSRDEYGDVHIPAVDCSHRTGLLERITGELSHSFDVNTEEARLRFVCDVTTASTQVDLVFILEALPCNDVARLEHAVLVGKQIQTGPVGLVVVPIEAFVETLAHVGPNERQVERYALLQALDRDRLLGRHSAAQRALAKQSTGSDANTRFGISKLASRALLDSLQSGAGFELPVSKAVPPDASIPNRRSRAGATARGSKDEGRGAAQAPGLAQARAPECDAAELVTTEMPDDMRRILDPKEAGSFAARATGQELERRYVEACEKHGVKLAKNTPNTHEAEGMHVPRPLDNRCVGAFVMHRGRVVLHTRTPHTVAPFVGPSQRLIREASFVYPLPADEVLHPMRRGDLEDVLQPFFGAYAHSRVVPRAIAAAVEGDRCQKLEVQVSSRNETGRMRSLGVASRTRQERIYKVVLQDEFEWDLGMADGAIFAEAAPPVTGSDSVPVGPPACLPAGVLVSFTVEEAGRVLLAQGDALYAEALHNLVEPLRTDAHVALVAAAADAARWGGTEEEMAYIKDQQFSEAMVRAWMNNQAIEREGRVLRLESRRSAGTMFDFSERPWTRISLGQAQFEHFEKGGARSLMFLSKYMSTLWTGKAGSNAEAGRLQTGDLVCGSAKQEGRCRWLRVTKIGTAATFVDLVRQDPDTFMPELDMEGLTDVEIDYEAYKQHQARGLRITSADWQGSVGHTGSVLYLLVEPIPDRAVLPSACLRLMQARGGFKAQPVFRRIGEALASRHHPVRAGRMPGSRRDSLDKKTRHQLARELQQRLHRRQLARDGLQGLAYALRMRVVRARGAESVSCRETLYRTVALVQSYAKLCRTQLAEQVVEDENAQRRAQAERLISEPGGTHTSACLSVAGGRVGLRLFVHSRGGVQTTARTVGLSAEDLEVDAVVVLSDCVSALHNEEQRSLELHGILEPSSREPTAGKIYAIQKQWRQPATVEAQPRMRGPRVYTVYAQWAPGAPHKSKDITPQPAPKRDDVRQRREWFTTGLHRVACAAELHDLTSIALADEQVMEYRDEVSAFAAQNPHLRVVVVQRPRTSVEGKRQAAHAEIEKAVSGARAFIDKKCKKNPVTRALAQSLSDSIEAQLRAQVDMTFEETPVAAALAAKATTTEPITDFHGAFAAALRGQDEGAQRQLRAAQREVDRGVELINQRHAEALEAEYSAGRVTLAEIRKDGELIRSATRGASVNLAARQPSPTQLQETSDGSVQHEGPFGRRAPLQVRGLSRPISARPVVSTRHGRYVPCRLLDLKVVDESGETRKHIDIEDNIYDSGSAITLFGHDLATRLLREHPEAVRRVDPLPSSIQRIHGIGARNSSLMWLAGTISLGGCLVDFEDAPVLKEFSGLLLGNDFIAATHALVSNLADPEARSSGTVTLRNESGQPISKPAHFVTDVRCEQMRPALANVASVNAAAVAVQGPCQLKFNFDGGTTRVVLTPTVTEEVRRAIGEVEPVAFAQTDLIVKPWCQQFIKLRVPASMPRDRPLAVLPLEDAQRVELGVLVAPTIETPSEDGFIVAMVINPTREAVRIPLLTPVARFIIDPQLSGPETEFNVDEVMERVHIGPQAADDRAKIRDMLRKRLSLFRTKLGYTHTPAVDIPTPRVDSGEVQAPSDGLRVRPQIEEQLLIDNNDKLERQHIVEPAGRTPYNATPIVLHKPDGSLRPAIDFRRLNGVVLKDSFPLPSIEANLNSLGRANWFSTLDLLQGFLQCELTESSKPKTAYTVGGRQYQYTRLPMGLTSSPSSFMRVVDAALRGLPPGIAFAYV